MKVLKLVLKNVPFPRSKQTNVIRKSLYSHSPLDKIEASYRAGSILPVTPIKQKSCARVMIPVVSERLDNSSFHLQAKTCLCERTGHDTHLWKSCSNGRLLPILWAVIQIYSWQWLRHQGSSFSESHFVLSEAPGLWQDSTQKGPEHPPGKRVIWELLRSLGRECHWPQPGWEFPIFLKNPSQVKATLSLSWISSYGLVFPALVDCKLS